jgi:hypothetical protein
MVGAVAFGGLAFGAEAKADPSGRTTILDTKSLWRARFIAESPELVLPNGDVQHATAKAGGAAGGEVGPKASYVLTTVTNVIRLPEDTPADWMKPGFDDGAWARIPGPLLAGSLNEGWKTILLRGLFEVSDPAAAGDLLLDLKFRGGVIVYLNGEALKRAFLPASADFLTPAEGYEEAAYYQPNGEPWSNYKDKASYEEKRNRKLTAFQVPAAKLRKGVNTLAISINRSPSLPSFYANRNSDHYDRVWSKLALFDVRLTAAAGAAVVPNTSVQPGRGFKVWTQSTIQSVFLSDYPDAYAPLNPVSLRMVRNGNASGQVIVGDEKPLVGLQAVASDLKGTAGSIPAAAVQIRYALPDGSSKERKVFDSLEESAPAEVPVYPEHKGSIQPVWLNIRVPVDAKPGDYAGTVTIRAQGMAPVTVPVQLKVLDFRLPDPLNYTARIDAIQSPESVALAYDVPLWSPQHFQLLERSFRLIGEMGGKSVFVTCIRRTHFGNEHAVVRWCYDKDDNLLPDFSVAERYIDAAQKGLGRIKSVTFYCWEPPESDGHAGVRVWDRPVLITLHDKESGRLLPREGPGWGTPEAAEFWKTFTDGAQAMLQRRGLADTMMFGLIGDSRPTKEAMNDICNAVPKARWVIQAHLYADTWQGYEMGMITTLWGINCIQCDPLAGRSLNWTNPRYLAYLARDGLKSSSSLVTHRAILERWIGAWPQGYGQTPMTKWGAPLQKGLGPMALGRLGADFWPVLKDDRGRLRGTLAGRFPEVAWGQLNLNNCTAALLGRGKTGPVATVRSEALRESIQEVEVRIYLEKALLDDEAPGLLGEDLVTRCRKVLDERIRMCNNGVDEGEAWYIGSDCNARNERLFRLAAEVAAKYGDKAPNPNLKMDTKKR